ncbi:MAG TPA: hypothetical protein PKE45_14480, partial [Caldilineaceae bacterium]|nr:hypothetical protein [Caldilineaceae bacterium]
DNQIRFQVEGAGRLAAVEQNHAAVWNEKLRTAGVDLPPFRPSWRTRTLIWLARRFGVGTVLPSVSALEQVDAHKYDQESGAGALAVDERSHAGRRAWRQRRACLQPQPGDGGGWRRACRQRDPGHRAGRVAGRRLFDGLG